MKNYISERKLHNIKDKFDSKFVRSLTYLLAAYITILLFLLLIRCIFFISNWDTIAAIDVPEKVKYIFKAFRRGFRFDNVIASYIMFLPLVVVPILALFNIFNRIVVNIANVYFIICGFLFLSVSIADIPYFLYFNRRIDSSILQWVEYSNETIGMVLQEKSFLAYFLLFIFLLALYIFIFFKLKKRFCRKVKDHHYTKTGYLKSGLLLILLYAFFLGGMFGFIRKGITLAHSYFCNEVLICHLVVNPLFFFTNVPASYQLSKFMDEEEAYSVINNELGFDIRDSLYYKTFSADTMVSKPNIIIIYMESYSSLYLDKKGKNGQPITPYISNLIDSAYYFSRFYSQGTHTNQAITASLYGLPSVFDKVMTVKAPIQLDIEMFKSNHLNRLRKESLILHGLPNELKNEGYYNQMFVTHTRTFDNLDYFTAVNGFDKLYGTEDYADVKFANVWGISDKDLLNNAMQKIDSLSAQGMPLFTSILTISNHPPYVYPEEFKRISDNEDENALAYMDSCIKDFMVEACSKEWYDNTIFVFMGDHGHYFHNSAAIHNFPLSLNHVPLIIYSPMFSDMPKHISSLMGQIDLYPVLMNLLGKSPAYKTFGVDILSDERKYIYFTSDDKMACMDKDYYYNYDFSYGMEFLYRLDDNKSENIIHENRAIADSMRTYSASMIEGVKYIIKNY